ncbi:MAG: 30S ribosomal protein S19e [Candidatus Aenigmatarchaeota archaeon]
MAAVKSVDANVLISKVVEDLKGREAIKQPEWALYIKTGTGRERPPEQEDWWHIRAASILRKMYVNQTVGVETLRKEYGGRKNMGHKPEHKVKAGGKIIRVLLQQLETAGLIKKEKEGGRSLTAVGKKLLNESASKIK